MSINLNDSPLDQNKSSHGPGKSVMFMEADQASNVNSNIVLPHTENLQIELPPDEVQH